MAEKFSRVIRTRDHMTDLFMPLELECCPGASIREALFAAKVIATTQYRSVIFIANEAKFIVSSKSDILNMLKEFMEPQIDASK